MGKSYDAKLIQTVWEKGLTVRGWDAEHYRRDEYGSSITREAYGDERHEEGWRIGHLIPIEDGGADDLSNLRPLQVKNHARVEGLPDPPEPRHDD